MALPKRIIQGWVGPSPMPERERQWCDEMRRMNPDFEYHLFGNEIMDKYGNDPYVRYMVNGGEKWAFIADRIRILILRDQGGIWIDPDSKPVRPLSRLPWWNAPHVDFATAHRSPYRPGVHLYRGISLVDNTVMASVPNGRIINQLVGIYDSRCPVRRGGDFGREMIEASGWDVVWESPKVFYSTSDHPEAVILHDGHNLASWVDHPPLQFADAKVH